MKCHLFLQSIALYITDTSCESFIVRMTGVEDEDSRAACKLLDKMRRCTLFRSIHDEFDSAYLLSALTEVHPRVRIDKYVHLEMTALELFFTILCCLFTSTHASSLNFNQSWNYLDLTQTNRITWTTDNTELFTFDLSLNLYDSWTYARPYRRVIAENLLSNQSAYDVPPQWAPDQALYALEANWTSSKIYSEAFRVYDWAETNATIAVYPALPRTTSPSSASASATASPNSSSQSPRGFRLKIFLAAFIPSICVAALFLYCAWRCIKKRSEKKKARKAAWARRRQEAPPVDYYTWTPPPRKEQAGKNIVKPLHEREHESVTASSSRVEGDIDRIEVMSARENVAMYKNQKDEDADEPPPPAYQP